MSVSDAPPSGAIVDRSIGVDVVSDVMCPWCYIGKRRLDAAIAELGDELRVNVSWLPFQLDPTLPPGGKDRQQYLNEKFGGPEGAANIYGRIEAVGREVGIAFDFEAIARSPNTLDAHRLIRWAGIDGRQDSVVENLFAAFFLNGRDIGDRDVLSDVAAASGMDAQMVARLLASDADLAEVEADAMRARTMGIDGVPCFILDGRYAISGAQPAEVMKTALLEIAAREEAPPEQR